MDTFDSYGYNTHTKGDSNYSVNEVGGTGKRIITVGSYVSKDIFGGTVGDISSISSKGPTVDGRHKPDITAAGEGVISSYSNSPNISQSSYYKPYLDYGTTVNENNQTYYYGAMSGTSMSAPIVTGIIALWLEARPTLLPEEIKEIIAKSAITDEYTGDISQPSNTWGYGKIDAWAGIKECLVLNGIDETESLSDKTILVKNNREGKTFNLLFTKNLNNIEIKIYDITGKLLYINKIPQIISGDEIIIETRDYKKGIYIINVIGDRISETIKVGLN